MKVMVSIAVSDKENTNKKFSNKVEFNSEQATDSIGAFTDRVSAAVKDSVNTFENICNS